MKKFFKPALICLILSMLLLPIGCGVLGIGKNVERYDLSYSSPIATSTYAYNYIEFNTDDMTFHLENKMAGENGTVTKTDGRYTLNGNQVKTYIDDREIYLFLQGESKRFNGSSFTIEYSLNSAGITLVDYVFIYKKQN